MEAYEYDTFRQEEKEQEDREYYNNTLEEIEYSLSNIFCQANLDDIEVDDLIKCIKNSFEDTQDMKIEITKGG